ncbi:MAG: spore germination protein [Bacillota bacterium]|nr:spore germination protein [Bacillota bacterium]
MKYLAEKKRTIKNYVFFSEPDKKKEGFILKDTPEESKIMEDSKLEKNTAVKKRKNDGLLLNKQSDVGNEAKEKKENKGDEDNKENEKGDISKKLSDNLEYIKKIYSVPTNVDIVLREFDIVVKEKVIPAFIVFYDGMTDRKVINDNILQPLMLLSNLDIKSDEKDIATYVRSHILPHNQVKEVKEFRKVIDEVNFGGCGLFIDGMEAAFAADVKGFEHRSVERPNTELVIRGPQEGFTELIRVNTALIRKRMKDEDLIVESVEIGRRSKTPCAVMYVKDIANESLIKEVKRRLKSIKIDYLNDSGELEQLIEDNTIVPVPLITSTERPDRASSALSEGKVVIIVNGSPFALVLPSTFYEQLHSPEDSYIRFPYANVLRIIRLMAMLLSMLLPGLYLAITNFHQEMIPTDLLIAIEAAREKVPFPTIIEILIMEFAFELIREAGIRIPGPIGPTLGIIGALILGQAAVAANIVSPILIIIVAVTGLGSFAIPSFSLSFAFRVTRFMYIFLGAATGFLGIATGIFFQGLWLVSAKSFGVPFMAPFGPTTSGGFIDMITRTPTWMQEKRPDYMNTKDENKQPEISRGWVKEQDKET